MPKKKARAKKKKAAATAKAVNVEFFKSKPSSNLGFFKTPPLLIEWSCSEKSLVVKSGFVARRVLKLTKVDL